MGHTSWKTTWRRDVLGAAVLLALATALGLVVNSFHPRAVRFSPDREERAPGEPGLGGPEGSQIRVVAADTLRAWLARGFCLALDARELDAFEKGHVPGARNLPVDFLADSADVLQRLPKERWLVCYCDGPPCDLGERLAYELRDWGFERVAVYQAGLADWRQRGFPIETGVGGRER